MLSILLSIIGIIFTIFFVVGTHEAAHFLVARLVGIKVLRFSIGFGKTLWSWHDKKGTEYVIAAIPLGGYVKMLDEREQFVAKKDLRFAYNHQPFYKRFLVVLAGPAMNFLCAFILYWLTFTLGFTTIRPLIGTVKPLSIASEAGIQGDQAILSVDQQITPTLMNVLFRLLSHVGNQDQITMELQNIHDQKITTHTLELSNWSMDPLMPDPLGSLGLVPYELPIPLTIGAIAPDSPAAASTLQLGDKLVAINSIPIKKWETLVTTVMSHPDQTIQLTVARKGKPITVAIVLSHHRDILLQKSGYLGIGPNYHIPPNLLHQVKYSGFAAIAPAWQQMMDLAYLNLLLFGKMITGKLSLQSLGGPITIFDSAGDALNSGFIAFIGFLAFLSISIGVINLLPIPGLDGGHLFIQLIELLIGRSVPDAALNIMYRIGFFILIFVIIQAVANDILRLY